MLTCKCGKKFDDVRAYSGHCAHCGKDKNSCPICGVMLSKYVFRSHVDSHKRDKKCLFCGKAIKYKHRFCSHSCAGAYNNNGIARKNSPAIYCKNCNSELLSRRGKYCSVACMQELSWSVRKQEIERIGEFPASLKGEVTKRYLLEKYGIICSVCKNTQWMKKQIPLELDHIDGNWENNDITNVRMVCGNCAMQLPTYKGKNRGNGRHYRKMRYREGKSY